MKTKNKLLSKENLTQIPKTIKIRSKKIEK
jgi:hypothetical protein